MTAGSQSIENSGTALRLAGAEARAILLELAAKKLGVAADTLSVVDGVISAADGRKVTYGEIAADADLKREATAKVAPKPPAAHKIVGQSVAAHDIPAKVTGGAAYVQDMRPAGMLHGRVVRPPRYGSTLESVDEAAVKAMPGVVAVVRDGSFLGVVAEREEQAIKAREALARSAKWKLGPDLPDPTQHPRPSEVAAERGRGHRRQAGARCSASAHVARGDLHQAVSGACLDRAILRARRIQGRQDDGVDPFAGRLSAARRACQGAEVAAAGRPLHPCRGLRLLRPQRRRRRGARCGAVGPRRAGPAGAAAMDARRRIRLGALWRRHVDARRRRRSTPMARSPTGTTNCGATPTPCGRSPPRGTNVLAAWYLAEPQKHGPPRGLPQPAGGGDRNALPLYDFPNQRIVHHFIPEMPIRVSALRTLGAYANVFARISWTSWRLLAKADPVAFRLAHMKDPRARAVIEKAAAMANWKPGEAGSLSRGRGIGFSKYKNLACYVAWSPTSRSTGRAARCACRRSGRRRMPGWSSIPTG